MQHLINFLGQMQNSLWIFAEQRIFAVMKWRLQDIFKEGMCDGAFLTEEYTYDAKILGAYYQETLNKRKNVNFIYEARIKEIIKDTSGFIVILEDGRELEASFILNATYASVNQILDKVKNIQTDKFKIKYELCEIILCEPSEKLKSTGITVMDVLFFYHAVWKNWFAFFDICNIYASCYII